MAKNRSNIGRSNVRSGKRLENRYANLWTEWTGETFRRRRVEGRGVAVSSVEGVADIICVSKNLKFAIESKKTAGFSFMATPFNFSSLFWKQWWSQVSIDTFVLNLRSDEHEYFPFIHFKPTPNHDFVGFYKSSLDHLELKGKMSGYEIFPNFDSFQAKAEVDGEIHTLQVESKGIFITSWKDFTKIVVPESVFYE